MIYDGYELWERFCIMTTEGTADDTAALGILRTKTTPRLYQWLEQKAREEKGKNGKQQ